MGKKRFVVLESEGSGFSNAMQEIVDTETGAHYLTWQSGCLLYTSPSPRDTR